MGGERLQNGEAKSKALAVQRGLPVRIGARMFASAIVDLGRLTFRDCLFMGRCREGLPAFRA